MPKILEAYLVWSYNQGEDPWSTLGDSYEGYEVESIIPNLKVVDIYSKSFFFFTIPNQFHRLG